VSVQFVHSAQNLHKKKKKNDRAVKGLKIDKDDRRGRWCSERRVRGQRVVRVEGTILPSLESDGSSHRIATRSPAMGVENKRE
jgi:hypothetical protein